jgi:hypothetical protein
MIGPWNKIGFRQIAFGGGGGGGGTNTPLETTISNQPHALAYITPSEEGLLRSLGGTGQAGPGGVPAFPPTNQYSSAAYVDSQGREFGKTYSSDPNQKPTQVDKITDVAGYGQGDGNDNDNDPAPVAATPAPVAPVAASTTYITPTLKDQATALGISTINNDRYMSDEGFAQGLQRKIDLVKRNRAFKEELRIKEEACSHS